MTKVLLAVVNTKCIRHEETHSEAKVASVITDDIINIPQPGYEEYIKKYGQHFSKKLANWVVSKMENSDGTDEHWTVDQVKNMWESAGYKLPKANTWGDVSYACNMALADYYPEPLKTNQDVLKQGYKDINDKDGYPGKIFNRWLSDVLGKGLIIPWEEMI